MKWYVEDIWEPEDAKDFPKEVPEESDTYAARRLADYAHARHDLWEVPWPLVFVIIDNEGVKHRFEVERHTVPEFTAYELKPPCPQCSTPHVEVRHNDECGAQD
jgi:hypothetical protein